jgi:hypothetical protein
VVDALRIKVLECCQVSNGMHQRIPRRYTALLVSCMHPATLSDRPAACQQHVPQRQHTYVLRKMHGLGSFVPA